MTYDAFIDVQVGARNDIGFFAKAVSKNSPIRATHYICIERGKAGQLIGIAIDGVRAHIVDPLPDVYDMSPGLWRVLKSDKKDTWIARLSNTDAEDVRYPEKILENIMPKDKPLHESYFNGFNFKQSNFEHAALLSLFRGFPTATVINMKYLADLGCISHCLDPDPANSWGVLWYGANKPVVFLWGAYTAVIMPMKINLSRGVTK